MSANFTPDMTGYKGLSPFRFWCQKTLPLVYDDSLSYYELLCKVVSYINNLITDVAAAEENVDKLLTAYNQLQEYVNEYFDGADFQQKIDDSLDRYAEDGTLSSMVNTHVSALLPYEVGQQIGPVVDEDLGPVVDLKLPAVVESKIAAPVATQLPAVVQTQIGGVVGNQIGDVVADQIDEVVADQITDAVSPLVHDEVAGLIRPAVSTELPAALQVYLPPEVQAQLPGAIGTDLESIAPPVIEDWLDAHPEATTSVPDGSISFSKLATDLQRRAGIVGTYFPSDFTNEYAWQVNQYAVYQGIVYRCIKTTTAGQAWNASEWTTANMNSDLFYMWWCLNYLSQSITTIDSSPATSAHEAGEYFIYYDGAHLYRLAKASSNIAVGDTLTPNGNFIYSSVANMIADLKSALGKLTDKYFYEEFAIPGDSYRFEVTDIYVDAGETIIVETTAASVGQITTTGGATNLSVNNVGAQEYTPDKAGYIRFYCRNFYGVIYYPDFSIVSARGNSKVKAASQKLVETAFDAVDGLSDEVQELSDNLDGKYDKYKVEPVSGLDLTDFAICPAQYTIVQYQNTDALQHGAITGYINSRFVSSIPDIHFKIYELRTLITLACTNEKAVAFNVNLTSGNVSLRSGSSESTLSGIYRNSNCRSVISGDTIHCVQDGTKIALYLVDNGVDIPIFADEFVDILTNYETSAGITETDVGFGFSTSTTERNEPIIYDVSKIVISGDHFMPYDEVDSRLSALENGAGFNPLKVDLFMFMGQSNMAGRGNGAQAPGVIAEAGYEFRAISDPTKLYPITEPFGLDENVENKIYDYLGGYKAKSGDMVPAFVNAYFAHTHVSIVGVSASEGGTRIALWQPDTARDTDALARYNAAINWLTSNGYTIRHKYMLWCQGESNGDDGMSKADYKSAFATFANAWFGRGIETIFLVKIGNYNGTSGYDYNTIMTAQNEICQETPNVVMVSTDFAGMKARGLMKDDFHYQQAAYNEVGNYAGINTAIYVNTEKEPTMYDTQDGTLYYTHKN